MKEGRIIIMKSMIMIDDTVIDALVHMAETFRHWEVKYVTILGA